MVRAFMAVTVGYLQVPVTPDHDFITGSLLHLLLPQLKTQLQESCDYFCILYFLGWKKV